MKRCIIALLILALIPAFTWSQSLLDNSYYRRSQELRAQAEGAYEDGDYDAASDYAAQAQEYIRLSDEYVVKMVALDKADRAINLATARMAWANDNNIAAGFPTEYSTASTEMASAQLSYEAEAFDEAALHAEAVLAALAATSAETVWPAKYIVLLIPQNRECLWKIAAYPFIYNDLFKWTLLYEANKKNFKDPSNPHLIFPGQELIIPPLQGESRSGTYDSSQEYGALPKK